MTYKHIETNEDKERFEIILNRPPLNVLNIEMIEEICRAIEEAARANSPVLLIKAKGKAFSAGVDVADHLGDKVERMIFSFHNIFRLLSSFKGLVASCVQGSAYGGGFELALFSDIAVVSSEAKFGFPEIKLGVFPPVAMVLLARICPFPLATELILLGDVLDAERACDLGLITKVFEANEFDFKVEEYLSKFKDLSSSSLQIAKETLRKIHFSDFQEKLALVEEVYLNRLMQTKDAQEGSKAFLEKRKPLWRGD